MEANAMEETFEEITVLGKPCSTVKEFMQNDLPNQKIMMRPAPPKPKSKENER